MSFAWAQKPSRGRDKRSQHAYIPPPAPEMPDPPARDRSDALYLGRVTVDRPEIPPLLGPCMHSQGRSNKLPPPSNMEANAEATCEGAGDKTTRATQLHDYWSGHPSLPPKGVRIFDTSGQICVAIIVIGLWMLATSKK